MRNCKTRALHCDVILACGLMWGSNWIWCGFMEATCLWIRTPKVLETWLWFLWYHPGFGKHSSNKRKPRPLTGSKPKQQPFVPTVKQRSIFQAKWPVPDLTFRPCCYFRLFLNGGLNRVCRGWGGENVVCCRSETFLFLLTQLRLWIYFYKHCLAF